jgi:glypican 4
MAELRPFGDAPHKLSLQVKRSFIATRTFNQALTIAAEVAENMLQVAPPPDCSHALTRMSGCNVCQGRPNTKACPGFCTNVMRGCLAYHSELETEWNSFVGKCDLLNLLIKIIFSPLINKF